MLITKINEMKKISENLKREGKRIGFVPTMGYLHKGHISLMECSKKENDITVVSIFVNPTQFRKNEDLDKYPRDLERDLKICKDVGVDYVFHPEVNDMYPEGYSTYVIMETLTDKLCGKYRPGHFKGVLTIVNKLFNIIKPDRAYFGKKDYQQYIVIKKMVKDLNMDVEIVGCPLVREEDGLALSSRNKYLSKQERERALSISKALFKAKSLFESGEKNVSNIKKQIESIMKPEVDEIQYIEIVNPDNLEPKEKAEKGDIILVAAFVGNTRLIDNIEL
ncbi:MAG: pantoate--beta-alanine ligase [Aquificota bacterium]|nr:MAG: pantoate--beta-alanine ligase [Aquificota bacterium]